MHSIWCQKLLYKLAKCKKKKHASFIVNGLFPSVLKAVEVSLSVSGNDESPEEKYFVPFFFLVASFLNFNVSANEVLKWCA